MLWLVPLFFLTALVYASVGFGGGSTYIALLAVAGADYRLIPPLALICNLLVVSGALVRFARAGLVPWRRAGVLLVLSVPAAFAGGLVPVGQATFSALLGGSLLAVGLVMLGTTPLDRAGDESTPHRLARFLPIAVVPLGFLAGIVGIGGGIFLAPLMHLVRWDQARRIAAAASLFIFANSLSGLAGQALKGEAGRMAAALDMGLPLLVAVVVGGQIGSLLAVRLLPVRAIRIGTAGLTLWAGGRMLAGVI